ncbi:MAG: hypothetical protein ABIQ30_12890 [Devosia sp.]
MIKLAALPLAALAFSAVPALAADIGCEGLFAQTATLADFEAAYGKANVVTGEIDGPEGTTLIATTVFPNDEDKTFTIYWWDEEKREGLSGFTIAKADTGPGGLKLGMSIEDVQKLNGGPFDLFSFYWDYGGSAGFSEGGLANQPGGCFVNVRFSPTIEPPTQAISDAVSGDQTLRSDLKALKAIKPVIDQINIGYPGPEDGGEGD